MADKTKTMAKLNLGIGSVAFQRTTSQTNRVYRYSCVVEFDTEDAAKQFRDAVEQGSSDIGGRMVQSSVEAVDKTK